MSLINIIKDKYYKLPEWFLQISGFIFYLFPDNIRYGKTYNKTMRMIKKNEYNNKEQLDNIIDEKFINIVRNAYYNVPFYKKYYDDNNVDIDSIKSINDIDKLPFIDKDIVKNHINEMISSKSNKKNLIYVTTSGSTGNPVGFYQPQEITMTEWAFTVNIWQRIGYNNRSKRLVLRGKQIHPSSKNKDYFYDPFRRELSCNIFDMNDVNLEEYVNLIEKYKPEFIHGYMSAIVVLAKYIDKNNIHLENRFKGILATSENIIEEQKKYVEKIFDTRVFSFYGHSERLIIAGQCETSDCYHVEPLYGYCEIIDEYGNNAQKGEIVATGFINFDMPLIRYRTGDIAIIRNDNDCNCKRNYIELERVLGRWRQDMLVNKDNSLVSLTALNIHSNEFDKIIRYKLIQYEIGKVQMQIQPMKSFTKRDEQRIKELLEIKSQNKILFDIKIVNSIPTLKNGKYSIIEQHIKIE